MKLLPPEPTYEMLRALAGDPPLLAASDEAELRKRYQAMRDSAPEYVPPRLLDDGEVEKLARKVAMPKYMHDTSEARLYLAHFVNEARALISL